MSFLSSIFLFALPLAAAPVIIHLMNRRRRDVIKWGAMQLLLDSTPRKRRIWQIDDLLLMIVRALAVAAIVFAFSRPQLRSGILSGKAPGRDVIIVVDSSLSTGRLVGGVPVFDEIRTRALELVNQLDQSDRVRLMIGAAVPTWVSFGESDGASATKEMVADRIAELKPTLATADIPNCVQAAIA
ncbi:MAG: VWA domain-containing protein, partial [Planctomycetaceae bacterium]